MCKRQGIELLDERWDGVLADLGMGDLGEHQQKIRRHVTILLVDGKVLFSEHS